MTSREAILHARFYPGITMEASGLDIRLLGELELRVDGGAPLRLGSSRAESLLAYLLLHRDAPQPRARLAGLLWPDSTEDQARTNLRHLLHTLRRSLPDADGYLDVTKTTLQWRDPGPFRLDVAAFEEAADRAESEAGTEAEVAALREAAAIYRRDLLEGHYDDWVLVERERLKQRHLAVLERLTSRLESREALDEAVVYAERLVRADPLREETYRVLMRLHDTRGDRAKALRVYHACAVTLEEEVGVAPSAATQHAYETLLGGDVRGATRPDAGTGPRRGALVGRATERSLLIDRWSICRAGRAQLVLVTGEPGIGKTRLVDEFRSWVARQRAVTATARSYRAEGELAFGPVTAWLGSDAYRSAPRPSPVTEAADRQAVLDALAAALLAPDVPVLLVADDLHWADRDTLQFLHYLLRSAPTAPLLVLATARREDLDAHHPLTELLTALQAAGAATEFELHRLSPNETAQLVEQETGQRPEPDAATRLQAETEGNPLFVLEALRAGWRGDDGPAVLTPRVQAVIEARLGQLSPTARELAGLAATIGRDFTAAMLAAAGDLPDDQLVTALDELWRRRLIRDRGTDAYDFSHDRIREVAYLGLPPARRRRHHLRVAGALEAAHRADPEVVSAQLAAHHEHGGEVEAAVRWYQTAAATAQEVHAHAEALRLLERGLELLGTLPDTVANRTRELAYLTALQAPLGAIEGWASERLEQTRARGLALAVELGVEPGPPLLQSLGITRVAQGEFAVAMRAAARLLAGDGASEDEVAAVQGEYVAGIAAYWNGELEQARDHFERAASRHRPDQVPLHLSRYGLDPKVVCLSRLANTLWFLGRPLTAARTRDHALAFGREVGHLHSLGIVHVFSAMLAVEQSDAATVREHVAALEADVGLRVPASELTTAALRAFVDVLDGPSHAGIATLVRVLDDTSEPEHAPGVRATIGRLLLQACRVTGDAERGADTADRLIAMGGAARLWLAEAERLRAEFLADLGAEPERVAASLAAALAVARSQRARAYELRTLASFVRLRVGGHVGGDVDESRRALSALLVELPEVATTPDGMEAAALDA